MAEAGNPGGRVAMVRALLVLVWATLVPENAFSRQIGADELVHLPIADVVILGEVHDNAQHHENQARAVRSLQPRALVFEMLDQDQAQRVTPELRDDAKALGAALGWETSGWPDFAMYHPIFMAARDASVHGGALPRDRVRAAMTQGAAQVFGPDAARYGLDLALDPADQAAREAEQLAAHCNALQPTMLPGMVAAQRLRDAALARAVVEAYQQSGGPVVVITGTGHARKDQGIPAALAVAAPELKVLSIGQIEAESDRRPDAQPGAERDLDTYAAPLFDLWLVTDPATRDDPCAAFR